MPNSNILNSSIKIGQSIPGQNLVSLLQVPVSAAREIFGFYQLRETEKTKRTEIKCNSDKEIAAIRENAQLLRDYFDKAFAERRENFDRFFQMLDAGLSSGNNQQIDTALSLIVTMIKESPLKQAAEIMQQVKNRTQGQIIDI